MVTPLIMTVNISDIPWWCSKSIIIINYYGLIINYIILLINLFITQQHETFQHHMPQQQVRCGLSEPSQSALLSFHHRSFQYQIPKQTNEQTANRLVRHQVLGLGGLDKHSGDMSHDRSMFSEVNPMWPTLFQLENGVRVWPSLRHSRSWRLPQQRGNGGNRHGSRFWFKPGSYVCCWPLRHGWSWRVKNKGGTDDKKVVMNTFIWHVRENRSQNHWIFFKFGGLFVGIFLCLTILLGYYDSGSCG